MWLRETVRKWIEGETGKIEGERFGEWVKRVDITLTITRRCVCVGGGGVKCVSV